MPKVVQIKECFECPHCMVNVYKDGSPKCSKLDAGVPEKGFLDDCPLLNVDRIRIPKGFKKESEHIISVYSDGKIQVTIYGSGHAIASLVADPSFLESGKSVIGAIRALKKRLNTLKEVAHELG